MEEYLEESSSERSNWCSVGCAVQATMSKTELIFIVPKCGDKYKILTLFENSEVHPGFCSMDWSPVGLIS